MLGDCPRESVCRYAQGTRERCRAGQVQSDDKGLNPAVGSRSKLKSLHLADGATATHGWSLAQSKGNTPYRCGVVSILIQRTCAREASGQNRKLVTKCAAQIPVLNPIARGPNRTARPARFGTSCVCLHHSAASITHWWRSIAARKPRVN